MSIAAAQLVAIVTADTLGAEASLARVGAAFDSTATSAGRGMGGAAKFGLGVAAVAVGVAIESLRMATSFQTNMTRLGTQAGASAREIALVTQEVYKLAPAVGIGPTELAKAFYHVESAGYRGATALQMVTAASKESQISGANLEDTTNSLVATMQSGITGFHGSAQAMGILNAIVGAGNMRFQDLNAAMGTGVEAAAATFGVSLQSVGAALALMTDMGVPAGQAATHLRMTMSLLGAPSKQAAKYLHDIGLSSADAGHRVSAMQLVLQKAGVTTTQIANDMKKPDGLAVALQDLKTHMEHAGLSATEQSALISRAFGGGKSGAAIMEMYNRLDLLRSKFHQIGQGASSFDQDWKKASGTFKVEIDKVRASIDVLLIKIGMRLIPIVEGMGRAFMTVVGFFEKHHTTFLVTASILGGIMVLALGVATGALVAFAVALVAATWPFILIGAAIGLLTLGIMELMNHWTTVWAAIKRVTADAGHWIVGVWHSIEGETSKVWGSILGFFRKVWGDISGAFTDGVHQIESGLRTGWAAITGAVSTAWGAVVGVVTRVWGQVSGAFTDGVAQISAALSTAWNWITNLTSTVWNAILGFFKEWWPLLLVVFAFPLAVLLAAWNHFHTQIMDVVHTVWNAITAVLTRVWNGLKVEAEFAWNLIKDYIVKPTEAVWHAIEKVWHTIEHLLTAFWDRLKRGAQRDWDLIKRYIVKPIEDAWHAVQRAADAVGRLLKAAWDREKRGAEKIWNEIKDAIVKVWDAIRKAVVDAATALWHDIERIFGEVKNTLTRLMHETWNAVKAIADSFVDIGKAICEGILHGIEHGASAVLNAAGNLAKAALQKAKDFLGINSPSKAFHEVGLGIGEGLVNGIGASTQSVANAAAALAKKATVAASGTFTLTGLVRGGDAPGVAASGPYTAMTAAYQPGIAQPSAGQQPVVVQVHVDGSSIAQAVSSQTKVVLTQVANKAANGRR